ncbi:ylmG homolog protein 1-2, chloroplastic-like [Prosopis cineraria]|uniref:ylmG homolog protein 1-2, chloroplastic-like n=1 Tax=Prosopis cineraria TaxID=364024 RepID=UPI00240F48BF|nr:ylmG homolog protein 1-2, chloroplastic-like [Prosopis cineraria]
MASPAMASSTQFLHTSFPRLPNLRLKYNPLAFPSFLPPKPTITFHSNPQSIRHFPLVRGALVSPSSALSPELPLQASPTSPPEILSGSTRTLATIFALGLSISRLCINLIQKIPLVPGPEQLAAILNLQRNAICAAGPLFFASLRDRPSGYLNTPLTVVAAGLAKWLDIYSGVLMVRVLLSWFPNIPWERQPLSAIRDLCDPYLNLFRNIIPPVFDTLDVSPLLAFAVLGTLGSILHGSSG